ncbi:MAG TPA: hypothetical protein VK641_03410 [Terriglobales bacterium]|nr:hypothetical protein [Terriglobales bacterium]
MSSLRDQVALVTGSSRSIGAAIAKLYAQHGVDKLEEYFRARPRAETHEKT